MNDEKILYLILQVLEIEIGIFANNFNWQKAWGLSDQEYKLLQKSRSRLTLKDS